MKEIERNLLPNFFIIGAAKAGTTTLFDLLKQNKQVFLPFQKEPAFFCDDEYYQQGIDWYRKTFFSGSYKHPLRGEATPRYLFWGEKVVPRLTIHYKDQTPKIIVIFREPVKLVYSHYWQNVREGREHLSFEDSLSAEESRLSSQKDYFYFHGKITYPYSKLGSFSSQLKPYLDYFPKENFLFLITEDLSNFPELITKLNTFLGIQTSLKLNPVISNQARLPKNKSLHQFFIKKSKIKEIVKPFIPPHLRHKLKKSALELNMKVITPPPMNPETVHQLKIHFTPEIKNLELIIQRDLSTWYQ